MSTIPPGGLTTTILDAGQAIRRGVDELDSAGTRVIAESVRASDPEDRVTISGGDFEGALMDVMKAGYGISANAALIERADEALQTVFEVFGGS